MHISSERDDCYCYRGYVYFMNYGYSTKYYIYRQEIENSANIQKIAEEVRNSYPVAARDGRIYYELPSTYNGSYCCYIVNTDAFTMKIPETFVVYGYLKDEEDRNKLVIDTYASEVVRAIFKWKLEGMSQGRIADKLNMQGVLCPMEYKIYDYYSKDLSVKVKTAKYQKMKQGKYLGGHVPYGLMKDPKDKHKLIIDPEAAAVVREIFDMAIAKMRLIDMARTLNERGVEPPGDYYRRKNSGSSKYAKASAQACWNHNNLRNTLQQEMYYGAIVGHKRQGLNVGCRHTSKVPKEEQFIVEGKYEGIVTKEEFLKAQEIFTKKRRSKKVIEKTYPLYRKVKCGTCGRAMVYKTYSRNGVAYRYFSCPHAKEQVDEDGCCKRYATEDNLNVIVWSAVRQLLDMTDSFDKKLDKLNRISRQDNMLLAEMLAGLQKEKEKCESVYGRSAG